jgi:hypothetical protein
MVLPAEALTMAGSGILNFSYQGGDASSQVTTNSGQGLTVNANPLFQFGSGNPSNSASGSASSSPDQNLSPSTSQVSAQTPAGVGLIPQATTAVVGALPQLSGNTWLLLGGVLALALILGGGGHHR